MDRNPFKDRVFYRESDIHHLPFGDRQFDLVWSSRTIHRLPDQIADVWELLRMSKQGGRLVLREGGQRPQYLPDDLGIGEPGLEERLERWVSSDERRSFISGEDAGTIQQLLDTVHPCCVFKRQDLHYLEG